MSENESEQKKESNRKKVTEILREKNIETKINEREKKGVALNDAKKMERKTNFYAKASEVKRLTGQ